MKRFHGDVKNQKEDPVIMGCLEWLEYFAKQQMELAFLLIIRAAKWNQKVFFI